jgi:hypothetical protein
MERVKLCDGYVVGHGRSSLTVKIDLQRALRGVQNQPAILTLFEMVAERHHTVSGEIAF